MSEEKEKVKCWKCSKDGEWLVSYSLKSFSTKEEHNVRLVTCAEHKDETEKQMSTWHETDKGKLFGLTR